MILTTVAGALIGIGVLAAIVAVVRNVRSGTRRTPGTGALVSVTIICGVLALLLLVLYFLPEQRDVDASLVR